MTKMLTLAKLFLASLLLLFTLNLSSQNSDRVSGELIVMLEPGLGHLSLDKTQFGRIALESKIEYVKELAPLSNIHLFSFEEEDVDAESLLRTIQAIPEIRAAQFNHFVKERALPNDPQIGNQWHHVDGSDNDIDSDLAWDITTGGTTANGDEIVVCVIEPGGANFNHSDLVANHWINTNEIPDNGVDDDGNGFVDDYNGWDPTTNSDNISAGSHGTAVSGMIGAKGNNGLGGAGVNWDVKIMQVEVGSLTESNVIASYSYPQAMRSLYNSSNGSEGAFVVATNASWGIDNANPASYPVWCAYYDDLGSEGILNCGATANNNVDIDAVGDMPTACGSDYMVSVTATNSSDQRTFSGYGATTIDLAAPGESVYLPSGSSNYSNTSGTSFASPCVAGAIALIYSAPCASLASMALSNPQAAADMVRGYIYNGVDPVSSLSNETVTGGRLNVNNALDLALASCGPPPVCDPIDITLSESCVLNEVSGTVEATITVGVSFDSDICDAETVCYQEQGGDLTCIDLNAGVLSNTSVFEISGLNSNTTYDIYYTTADGVSVTETITTAGCSDVIVGCTDPSALNYNSDASVDDGSCQFPCSDVSLSVLTDCWATEVSWEILDDQGSVVASVSSGDYEDESLNTWSQCLSPGCYTFNIFDSFGDGMSGSTYSSCGVDGDYDMVGPDGEILFEMGSANYGSQSSHTFCVQENVVPPCAKPYPQVTGLTSTIQSGGVLLQWDPIIGSIGCQVQGGIVGGGLTSVTVSQNEASQLFVSNNGLQSGQAYQWRVRCGCSTSPLIAGAWSGVDQFFPAAARSAFGSGDDREQSAKIVPNPTNGFTRIVLNSDESFSGTISLFDIAGKLVLQRNVALLKGENTVQLNLADHTPGLYLLTARWGNEVFQSKLIIQ